MRLPILKKTCYYAKLVELENLSLANKVLSPAYDIIAIYKTIKANALNNSDRVKREFFDDTERYKDQQNLLAMLFECNIYSVIKITSFYNQETNENHIRKLDFFIIEGDPYLHSVITHNCFKLRNNRFVELSFDAQKTSSKYINTFEIIEREPIIIQQDGQELHANLHDHILRLTVKDKNIGVGTYKLIPGNSIQNFCFGYSRY